MIEVGNVGKTEVSQQQTRLRVYSHDNGSVRLYEHADVNVAIKHVKLS